MKFIIHKDIDFYYVGLIGGTYISYAFTNEIIKILSIPLEEYDDLMIRYGGTRYHSEDWDQMDWIFKSKEDVESVIGELEPYLIMANLTE
jgi:hypothetical protein